MKKVEKFWNIFQEKVSSIICVSLKIHFLKNYRITNQYINFGNVLKKVSKIIFSLAEHDLFSSHMLSSQTFTRYRASWGTQNFNFPKFNETQKKFYFVNASLKATSLGSFLPRLPNLSPETV